MKYNVCNLLHSIVDASSMQDNVHIIMVFFSHRGNSKLYIIIAPATVRTHPEVLVEFIIIIIDIIIILLLLSL